MRVVRTIGSLRQEIKKIKSREKTIGFVPTMGALHEGHLSLIRKARRENDVVMVSVFVNPKQFGPKEDFQAYPRPEKKDILLAKDEKVDIIFHPSEKEMYPTGFLTSISVEGITGILCGASRPGHFRGVTTVVGKLLNLIEPDILYLGQKDAQQAIVIKRMVADLNLPVTVKICPTIRDDDGLALSSRNQYLTPDQQQEAPILFRALKIGKKNILNGERNAAKIVDCIRKTITKHSKGKVDYIVCVNADTLAPVEWIKGRIMLALAVKFGQTRLIDNIVVRA
ncbi:MAG: pantoate--beta-alanine ligase [Candidatus Omnitrophica bacterium]|nr:pantoate--beta-alanine ligase [Candidatus Omnitrophota bacterium]